MSAARRRAGATALLACSALLAGAAGAEEADRPAYRKLRYEEDWSPLRDPARRTELLDRIKYVPLDAAGWAYLSFGGEIRERYEYTRNPAWGEDPQDPHGVVLQRYVVHADLHVGPRVRVFGQLLAALEDGRAGPPSTLDENELGVQQAFLDLELPVAPSATATLRLGRQEMSYGSGRIVDVREGPNVRRKFDGGRVLLRLAGWRVDAIATRPSRLRTGVFDDGIDRSQALWGVYAVGEPGLLPTGLDLYYLGYENDAARYDAGTAHETRHSVGLRVWGDDAGWDWNGETLFQWGRFGDGAIRAWTAASDTGYTFEALPGRPRVGLGANIASGDRDASDGDLQTFNPLYPRGSYFSELALLGPLNFFNFHPFLAIVPLRDLAVVADVDFFWRLSRDDGIYRPSGALLRSGQGARARYVGTELSLNATWQATHQLAVTGIYSHFFPGRFVAETGPSKDIDFFELTLRFLF